MDERDLKQRLDAALDGLQTGQVDVVTLVQGARVGARRVRRRRRAAAGAALAVVVAVPLGAASVTSWLQRSDDATRAAASVPDAQLLVTRAPDATQTPSQAPSQTPTATTEAPPAPDVDPSTLDPLEVAFEIPVDVLPSPGDVPRDVVPLLEPAQGRLVPVVGDQACDSFDSFDSGPLPIAGVLSTLAEENSNRLDQLQVNTNVTGYSRDQGAAAFGDALGDTGPCRWVNEALAARFTDQAGRAAFTRTTTLGDTQVPNAQTVVQVGDLLVGVHVAGDVEGVDVTQLSRDTAELVAGRLVDAEVPGSAG